ncbi:alpha/beta hydrolase [Chloroflexia bacterium SDU3-3]|nr:alpha/beta hydrolase [Chloroflexia bacterium SDU3-3]
MTQAQRSTYLQDGIEWVHVKPATPKFARPLLFQHGMWHGAWCWDYWQQLFAEWGWESYAISLPGHGGAPRQRPARWCTLGYYLGFLASAIERLPTPPILFAHSMGGALAQWYLKYHGDLPAAVMVAPWPSHMLLPAFWGALRRDPLGGLINQITLTSNGSIRTPASAASLLITKGARYTPEELHRQLSPESGIILYQHNPPFWSPPRQVHTPMLWCAGADDAVIPEPMERRSAAHYGAEYLRIPSAGHNLMMEHNALETAQSIQAWLAERDWSAD